MARLPGPKDIGQKRFVDNWTKLRLWSMEEYDRVMYIDGDAIVRRNIDHLFAMPRELDFAAAPDRPPDLNHGFNAGVILLRPCAAVFADMVLHLHDRYDAAFAEQSFLNYYYGASITLLPEIYNAFWRHIGRLEPEEIIVMHFSGKFAKPWEPAGASSRNPVSPWVDAWREARDSC